MFALSVRPPWAHAINHMGNTIENRSWKPRYRGQLLIHAGKAMTKADYEDFAQFIKSRRLGAVPEPEDFRRGGIIGKVDFLDVVQSSRSAWFGGPIGWQLCKPKALPFRAWKGQLGLFHVD